MHIYKIKTSTKKALKIVSSQWNENKNHSVTGLSLMPNKNRVLEYPYTYHGFNAQFVVKKIETMTGAKKYRAIQQKHAQNLGATLKANVRYQIELILGVK